MANSPITSEVGVISFEVTSDGTALKDSYLVKSITVQKDVNRIPTATLVLFDGDPANQEFPVSDSSDLIPGKEIEIKAGYESDNNSIFKGIVVKHSVSFDQYGAPQLEVIIKDKALKMTVARKNAYFKEKKDSDVITSLIGDAGLTADVKATTIEHPMIVQHYTSDWDFMLSLADTNGALVIVDSGTVSVKPPETSASAVLTVTYGVDLIQFKGELNADTQLSAVGAKSWDLSSQALAENTGANPSLNTQGNITSTTLADVLGVSDFNFQSSAAIDAPSLKTWADAQLLKSWMNKITGSATFQGSSLAKPGVIIEFAGVGDRFNGNAYISGVKHSIEDGNWLTEVTLGMPVDWHLEKPDVIAPLTSGVIPGINGLMIGKVKQLEEDPDNEFRILVKIPMMQDDSNGIWARLSTFYATNGAGTFFIPEVDDEVVVGFLNNDPRFPIIIGSMYSSTIPPGKDVDGTDYSLTADNFKKAFLTKGQNKIEFDDDKKIITITTPGANKVVFDDDDKSITVLDQNQNKIYLNEDGIALTDLSKNKITMTSSGIELNSASDIKLVAKGDITAQSTGNTSVNATGNFEAKGMEVSMTANTTFTAKGTASAEVSASGQLTLKGAMVMIN